MGLQAFRCGANVVAYIKDNKKYGMTCAWAMMSNYSQVMMLLGGQSETGNNISLGDIVGISALAEGQASIARTIGMNHSSKIDKFANIKYHLYNGAILIDDVKVQMLAKAVKIENNDGDHLITFDILKYETKDNIDYLDGYDPKCYHE